MATSAARVRPILGIYLAADYICSLLFLLTVALICINLAKFCDIHFLCNFIYLYESSDVLFFDLLMQFFELFFFFEFFIHILF